MVLRMAQPIKRGDVYWLRKKVPLDLRAHEGKTEEKQSLKTRDPAEARVRFAKLNAEIEEKWARLRQGLRSPLSLTHKEAYAIAGEIYREQRERFEREPNGLWMYDLMLQEVAKPKSTSFCFFGGEYGIKARQFAEKMLAKAANPVEVDEYLSRHGLIVDEVSRDKLRKAVIQSKNYANRQIQRIREGDISPDSFTDPYPTSVPEATATETDGVTKLSEAIDDWVAEKTRKDGEWVESSAAANELWARRFQELAGDKPLKDYNKADARNFKKAIRTLPPNFLHKEDFRKLDFIEAVEKAASKKFGSMSDRNVNKILGFVRAFWNWAEGQYDHVPPNPFGKMNLRIKTKARDERDPFTTEQLQKIFDAPLYVGCQSGKYHLTKGDHVPFQESIYWVPLVGLFTGARSGEIIQLLCDDVKFEAGIRYFDIRDDGKREKDDVQQGLKTDSSVRTIPVHPILEKLGFATFVERQRAKGQRLFPDFPKAVDGYYSTAYSPRFRRFLVSIQVKTKKLSFHSFRHSFEDACLNSRIPLEFANALQGHSDGGMADRYGTGLVRIRLLNEEMQKLEYEGLDFSRLIAARSDLGHADS